MSDQFILAILKWFGFADALLLLAAGALFLAWLSVEYVARITGIAKALVQWKLDKWRASRIVTTKDSSHG